MKNKIAFVLGFIYTVGFFYWGGIDFNQRGFYQACSLVIAIITVILAVFIIHEENND